MKKKEIKYECLNVAGEVVFVGNGPAVLEYCDNNLVKDVRVKGIDKKIPVYVSYSTFLPFRFVRELKDIDLIHYEILSIFRKIDDLPYNDALKDSVKSELAKFFDYPIDWDFCI